MSQPLIAAIHVYPTPSGARYEYECLLHYTHESRVEAAQCSRRFLATPWVLHRTPLDEETTS